MSRLAPGVSGADHDDVKRFLHGFSTVEDAEHTLPGTPHDLSLLSLFIRDLDVVHPDRPPRFLAFARSLLANAEPREDMRQHFVAGPSPDNGFKRGPRLLQIREHELFRQ